MDRNNVHEQQKMKRACARIGTIIDSNHGAATAAVSPTVHGCPAAHTAAIDPIASIAASSVASCLSSAAPARTVTIAVPPLCG